MKYHHPTKAFTVDPKDLERASDSLMWAIKCIRETAKLPLEPRKTEVGMEPPDFAEQAILDAAKALGIDLGAERYGRLDVRGYD